MKVKFVPQNVEFDIKPGESVMHVAQDHGLYIKSVCKGVPSCAECRVRVVEGEHNVLPPGSEELGLIGTGHFIDRRRLSCQLKCFGDITVDMTEQIEKQTLGGKKSKKQVVKDDRVEESVAIRGGSFDDEADAVTDGEASERSGERAPQRQGSKHEQRPQQQSRHQQAKPQSGGGAQNQPKNQQKQGQQQQAKAGESQSGAGPGPEREGGAKKRRRRRRGRGGGSGQTNTGGSSSGSSGPAPKGE